MIIGIGVDIESIDRFKDLCRDSHFLGLIFTKRERDYCQKMKESHICYAGKFCAKEAVIKALGNKLPMKNIEVLNSEKGKPLVFVKGNDGLKIYCSISHTSDYAVANIVAEDTNG